MRTGNLLYGDWQSGAPSFLVQRVRQILLAKVPQGLDRMDWQVPGGWFLVVLRDGDMVKVLDSTILKYRAHPRGIEVILLTMTGEPQQHGQLVPLRITATLQPVVVPPIPPLRGKSGSKGSGIQEARKIIMDRLTETLSTHLEEAVEEGWSLPGVLAEEWMIVWIQLLLLRSLQVFRLFCSKRLNHEQTLQQFKLLGKLLKQVTGLRELSS